MKKWIFSTLLMLSTALNTVSIEAMIAHPHDHAPGVFKAQDAQFLNPDTVPDRQLEVRAMQIDGFSGASLEKLEHAFGVLEAVVNTEEFKTRVINFKNSKGERAFASNTGKSNEEIYEFFMDGEETLQPNTTGEINFFLKLYNRPFSKVIGWTNGDINTIHINWKFFKNFKPQDVAGNLAHEWTHKLGFGHKSAKEHDSVPYAIGYIVREMGERYLKGEELR